jgi:hypothetical protein
LFCCPAKDSAAEADNKESSSTYTENEQTADITPRHVLAVAVIDSLDTT